MREVAVIGVGQSIFGKMPEKPIFELGQEAVRAALKDAAISPKEIQVAYLSRLYLGESAVNAQNVLADVGIRYIEMVNCENACAGGSTAFRGVWKDIASGLYDVGIAIGIESMTTSPIAHKMIPPGKDDLEGLLGLTMPAFFGLLAHRYIEQYGAKVEDFARVSVKNHHHGCLNPFSQYKKEFTVEEILNSRMISDPITLLQCCPNTDGAAAAILCSMDKVRTYTSAPIKVAASVLLSGNYKYLQDDMLFSDIGSKAAKMAYEMAGIGPEDIDVIELHDAFAPEEVFRYEEFGLCARGEGAQLLNSGATELGGKIPVNPSGGLLSLGHPLSASGVRQVAELTWQLRGQAGARQVPNAKVAFAHMLGGTVPSLDAGACGIEIFTR